MRTLPFVIRYHFIVIHKIMGKALLTLPKKMDLGGISFGRLTQNKILQFHNSYPEAMMNKIGDVDNMTNVILDMMYHCSNTDENPQHHKCPLG